MKTKTLLIAMATLAVGVISSQAQVYSANVVGYINQPIAAGKFAIVGSQLINGSDVNATNGDINTTMISGLISSQSASPSTSTNTVLLNWSTAFGAFTLSYYYTGADADVAFNSAGHVTGWYSAGGVLSTIKLKNGLACFLHNTAAIPLTNTVVGTVNQGTTFPAGITITGNKFNLLCNIAPVVTNLVVDAGGNQLPFGLPAASLTSTPNPAASGLNDKLLVWNAAFNAYATYYFYTGANADSVFSGSGHVTGFYTAGGVLMLPTAWPNVNNGYFLYHVGSSFTYTPTFTIQ